MVVSFTSHPVTPASVAFRTWPLAPRPSQSIHNLTCHQYLYGGKTTSHSHWTLGVRNFAAVYAEIEVNSTERCLWLWLQDKPTAKSNAHFGYEQQLKETGFEDKNVWNYTLPFKSP